MSVEQETSDRLTVVGIGTSAGGLTALRQATIRLPLETATSSGGSLGAEGT